MEKIKMMFQVLVSSLKTRSAVKGDARSQKMLQFLLRQNHPNQCVSHAAHLLGTLFPCPFPPLPTPPLYSLQNYKNIENGHKIIKHTLSQKE